MLQLTSIPWYIKSLIWGITIKHLWMAPSSEGTIKRTLLLLYEYQADVCRS